MIWDLMVKNTKRFLGFKSILPGGLNFISSFPLTAGYLLMASSYFAE